MASAMVAAQLNVRESRYAIHSNSLALWFLSSAWTSLDGSWMGGVALAVATMVRFCTHNAPTHPRVPIER